MDNKKIIEETLERFSDKAYPTKEAVSEALLTKKLKIYLGVDPTGPHLHLGHATNLLVLKKFQELGHKVIFLIGDFTGRIGDPSGRTNARKQLTKKDVEENMATFKKQAAKLIKFAGPNTVKLERNSKWHSKMTFEKLIGLAQHFTVQQMIERDMFQERLKAEQVIGLHEFLYPLMQGYDSVAMNVDMEIGGTDQTFNMLAGRKLQRILNHKEKFVLTTKLLINPKTGNKLMNKSEGGLINLDDKPKEMFGKVMAIPDEGILPIALLCTEMPIEKAKNLIIEFQNPRDAKLTLAFEVVKLYHSEKEAEKAKEEWIKTNSEKEIPSNIEVQKVPAITLTSGTLAVLTNLGIKSKSEGRRLLAQGAIEVDGKTVKDPNEKRKSGEVIKIGKHKFRKIR